METLEQPMSLNEVAARGLILEEMSGGPQDTPAQLLEAIIVDAYRSSVSEISIESGVDGTHVWFRMDGVMLDYMQVPVHFCAGLVARAKIMCRLDVFEQRIAQIGRVDFQQIGAERIELRVAIIPVSPGCEDMRMRLLRAPQPLAA